MHIITDERNKIPAVESVGNLNSRGIALCSDLFSSVGEFMYLSVLCVCKCNASPTQFPGEVTRRIRVPGTGCVCAGNQIQVLCENNQCS